jgi:hypothetical protein
MPHRFRSPALALFVCITLNGCTRTTGKVNPVVQVDNTVVSGTYTDSVTGKKSLGVWLNDRNGSNKRLLIDHGDAVAVGEPLLSIDSKTVFFTAQHPGRYELHRYTIGSAEVRTLLEQPQPISQEVIQELIKLDAPVTIPQTTPTTLPPNLPTTLTTNLPSTLPANQGPNLTNIELPNDFQVLT